MLADRYVPSWRRPPPKRPRWLPAPAVGVASAMALVLLFIPPEYGLNTPISFQLAAHEPGAWLMVLIIVFILLVLAWRMLKFERYVSSATLVLQVAGLAYIGFSDPTSDEHFFVFILTISSALVWLWRLATELEDTVLQVLAGGAMLGAFISPFFMGYGERILVACSLAGANLLYYGYFVED